MQSATSPQNLIRLRDLPLQELDLILERARSLKLRPSPNEFAGQTVGLLFFRGSLRTRISLEVAMHQLGGDTIELTAASDFWDLEDSRRLGHGRARARSTSRTRPTVLSRYLDVLADPPSSSRVEIVARRTAATTSIRDLGRATPPVPVINMESALWHPAAGPRRFDDPEAKSLARDSRASAWPITWVQLPRPTASAAVVHSLVLAMALRQGMDVRDRAPAKATTSTRGSAWRARRRPR